MRDIKMVESMLELQKLRTPSGWLDSCSIVEGTEMNIVIHSLLSKMTFRKSSVQRTWTGFLLLQKHSIFSTTRNYLDLTKDICDANMAEADRK